MSEQEYFSPGSVVPVSGEYKCSFCGDTGAANTFAKLFKDTGIDVGQYESKAHSNTTSFFEKGTVFSSCPNCGNSTMWVYSRATAYTPVAPATAYTPVAPATAYTPVAPAAVPQGKTMRMVSPGQAPAEQSGMMAGQTLQSGNNRANPYPAGSYAMNTPNNFSNHHYEYMKKDGKRKTCFGFGVAACFIGWDILLFTVINLCVEMVNKTSRVKDALITILVAGIFAVIPLSITGILLIRYARKLKKALMQLDEPPANVFKRNSNKTVRTVFGYIFALIGFAVSLAMIVMLIFDGSAHLIEPVAGAYMAVFGFSLPLLALGIFMVNKVSDRSKWAKHSGIAIICVLTVSLLAVSFGRLLGNTGEVVKTYANQGRYTGHMYMGSREGQGIMQWNDGSIYEGEWEYDEITGFGTMSYAGGGVYTGDFMVGTFHGKGKMTFSNGDIYDGEWYYGKRQGQGIYTFADGTEYTGELTQDMFSGEGKMVYPNGDIYIGEWQNDKRNGYGVLTTASGEVLVGDWKDDLFIEDTM